MNDQNLLLEFLDKSAYNEYLKPFYFDLELLSKDQPELVIDLVRHSTSKEDLCRFLGRCLLDAAGKTRGGLSPHTTYFLLTLYTNYRPTPLVLYNNT